MGQAAGSGRRAGARGGWLPRRGAVDVGEPELAAARAAPSLLDAAPDAGLAPLAAFRVVMQSVLLPPLLPGQGLWAIGPVFEGSEIMPGDADLGVGGLLTELKTTSKKTSLGVTGLWQMLGHVFMDCAGDLASPTWRFSPHGTATSRSGISTCLYRCSLAGQ
jgi:hypothetical protein